MRKTISTIILAVGFGIFCWSGIKLTQANAGIVMGNRKAMVKTVAVLPQIPDPPTKKNVSKKTGPWTPIAKTGPWTPIA